MFSLRTMTSSISPSYFVEAGPGRPAPDVSGADAPAVTTDRSNALEPVGFNFIGVVDQMGRAAVEARHFHQARELELFLDPTTKSASTRRFTSSFTASCRFCVA